MSRSIKKGPLTDEHLLKEIAAQENAEKKQVIKIWSRRSTIFPSFVSLTITTYGGRKHVPVYVTKDVTGHKLGEFVPAKTFRDHKADDKATRQ